MSGRQRVLMMRSVEASEKRKGVVGCLLMDGLRRMTAKVSAFPTMPRAAQTEAATKATSLCVSLISGSEATENGGLPQRPSAANGMTGGGGGGGGDDDGDDDDDGDNVGGVGVPDGAALARLPPHCSPTIFNQGDLEAGSLLETPPTAVGTFSPPLRLSLIINPFFFARKLSSFRPCAIHSVHPLYVSDVM